MSQATSLSDLHHLLQQPRMLNPHHQPLGVVRAGSAWAWADPVAVPRSGAALPPPLPLPLPYPLPAPHSAPYRAPAHPTSIIPPAPPTPLAPLAPLAPAASAVSAVPTPYAAPAAGERREVRMAPALLAAMTAAAAATGRHESEIWAEAAREWLARHTPDDDPPPPPGAIQRAPVVRAARDRCWGAIDVLLGDLRHPRPTFDSPINATEPVDPAA
jgi:hypothetical protein